MPKFLRIVLWVWLAIQGLLLAFILATHGVGMELDLRLVSGAAMVLASFPLSLLSMFASLSGLEKLAVQGLLVSALVNWTGCFIAGIVELWILSALVKRLRAARTKWSVK